LMRIHVGSVNQIVVACIGSGIGRGFCRDSSAQSVANKIGEQHIRVEPAELSELIQRPGDRAGVAVEVNQCRPMRGVRVFGAVGEKSSAEDGYDMIARGGGEMDLFGARLRRNNGFGFALIHVAWKDQNVRETTSGCTNSQASKQGYAKASQRRKANGGA
jgi:hypothetical protein